MKRRDFLKNTIPASITLPGLIGGFSVKALAENSPLVQSLMLPVTETDNVLVLIQLNGGNDGLNTVIPLEYYSNYFNARTNVAIPENKVLNLSGTNKIGFHPAMTGLQSIFNEGQAAIIQSVGYPSPNFSHFRATDIWMSGSDSNQVVNSGWAGRYLNYEYANFPNGYPNSTMTDPLAIQIGAVSSFALQGPAVNMGMSITSTSNFYNLLNGVQDPAPNTPAGKELTYIRLVAKQTDQYTTVVKNAAAKVTVQAPYPSGNSLADQLKIVARLIGGGLKTRIYVVNMGGFDTHASQVNSTDTTTGAHATLLQRLSDAIKAFQGDLKFLGVENRVAGMTFSEFGRRIKSNGSTGTDHGSAAPLIVFGKHVKGGIIGQTPTIAANVSVNDNIPFQYDFRSVYATMLEQWLCVKKEDIKTILLKEFPTLPLIHATGCKGGNPNISGDTLITNYPNPFTNSTRITYVTEGGYTLVQIMDTSGRVLKNLVSADMAAGTYNVTFDSENLPTGVYYARLQNMANQQVRPMLKVR